MRRRETLWVPTAFPPGRLQAHGDVKPQEAPVLRAAEVVRGHAPRAPGGAAAMPFFDGVGHF